MTGDVGDCGPEWERREGNDSTGLRADVPKARGCLGPAKPGEEWVEACCRRSEMAEVKLRRATGQQGKGRRARVICVSGRAWSWTDRHMHQGGGRREVDDFFL
jgi:hypothetical protein